MLDGVHARGRAFVFRQELSEKNGKKKKGLKHIWAALIHPVMTRTVLDPYDRVVLPVVDQPNGPSHLFQTRWPVESFVGALLLSRSRKSILWSVPE